MNGWMHELMSDLPAFCQGYAGRGKMEGLGSWLIPVEVNTVHLILPKFPMIRNPKPEIRNPE
ncbi:MAG: hypothetical protein K9I68_08615 [Bacteroidales bacterium]|nr:hypothetical protein [Bacteroidales bacterium]MCF8336821.1 hypothetical protein [Bacteroidales bacterium]